MVDPAEKRIEHPEPTEPTPEERRAEVVREVATDAAETPEAYLRDSEVREGGE
jgi:hypothetical protein